jgi:hypothetical protein
MALGKGANDKPSAYTNEVTFMLSAGGQPPGVDGGHGGGGADATHDPSADAGIHQLDGSVAHDAGHNAADAGAEVAHAGVHP